MAALGRRDFFRLNAAALAGATLSPNHARAALQGRGRPGSAPDGFYRFVLGDIDIRVLSDGFFKIPSDVLGSEFDAAEVLATNVEPEIREEYFRSRMVPVDDLPTQASPVLVGVGGRRVLVDTGWLSGSKPPSTMGRLGDALRAAHVTPESVDSVVLTHAHPDHTGGLLDPTSGKPAFPNAEVVLSEAELEHWTGDDPSDSVFQPSIERILDAVDDRLRPIRDGDEVVSGMRSLATPGHTPGHLALAIEGAGQQVLLVGDALASIHTAFEHPEWGFLFDADEEQAGRTRRKLLDRAATDQVLLLGYHFPFPGIGYALRSGDAYRWHPAGGRVLA